MREPDCMEAWQRSLIQVALRALRFNARLAFRKPVSFALVPLYSRFGPTILAGELGDAGYRTAQHSL